METSSADANAFALWAVPQCNVVANTHAVLVDLEAQVRVIFHAGGWWVREDHGYYSVTWAPLGMAVFIIRERGLWGLLRRLPEIPSRIERAKQWAVTETHELRRLRSL